MADIIEETWFIGVMAGVGAIVIILIIIIVVLCCLWFRKVKKRDEQTDFKNNNQEAPPDENWTLSKPDRKVSPPSSSNSSQIMRGNEATFAGSSMIHMNQEMRSNEVHTSTQTTGTQTTMERALEGNRYVDAFPQNGDLGRGTEVNSSARFSRSEFRGSYQKPRMANVSVSSIKKNQSTYNYNGPVASPYSYRIPNEDYENSSIIMYTPEEKTAWTSSRKVSTEGGKVKEMATHIERRGSVTSPPTSPSRIVVENEIRELKEHERTAPIKKRLSNRTPASQAPPKRVSSYINEEFYEEEEPQVSNIHHHAGWQVKSGTKTIETRVNRYKKVGAVSVFPD